MTAEISPTARALTVLELIQNRPGITAHQLAERLAVSERAARRHVAILREAGIPVESIRGRYGGYRMGRGLRIPPMMFTGAEALGLVMGILEGPHGAGAADPDTPTGSALAKLIRALPSSIAGPAEVVRSTGTGRTDPEAVSPDPETTAALVCAGVARRRVRLTYRWGPQAQRSMDVDPWSVVVRYGRWYLLCWSHAKNARRTLRVDRVADVEVLSDVFSPPADLDPVGELEAHLSSGWRYRVEVVVYAPMPRVARCLPPALGRLEPLGDDRTRLLATTSDPDWYAGELATLGMPFRIVDSPELREATARLARRLLAAGEG